MRTKILLFLASVLIMAIPAYAKREPGSKVGAEFPELVLISSPLISKAALCTMCSI